MIVNIPRVRDFILSIYNLIVMPRALIRLGNHINNDAFSKARLRDI